MIYLKYLFWGALACSYPLNIHGATSYAKMEFVRLPAGIFTMGSKEKFCGYPVLVQLSAFSLGKTEVTQAQWKAVMGYNPSEHKGDKLPVENVSWDDAMNFCKRLTEKEHNAGRLPRNLKFTLPTEAQWEYACRAGTKTHFCFGNSISLFPQYGNFADKSYFNAHPHMKNSTHPLATNEEKTFNDGFAETAPVGCFQPNAWGFYDMHGNVSEWCLDYYDSDSTLKGGKDPVRTTPGNDEYGTRRIVRGGSFYEPIAMSSSALRFPASFSTKSFGTGFRVAIVRASNP